MADIFVRPYDDRGRKSPWKALLTIAAILLLAGGGVWWWLSRRAPEPRDHANQPVEQAQPSAVSPSKPAGPSSPSAPSSSSGNDAQAAQLFERAQQLAGAGRLQDASDLLGRVISSASDESLRNNALRVQGRINVQLFLSPAPTPEKKRYVIQPGDSLDRIARQNKTTVDLLRRMNNIEGNLIYPGATLMVPAAPFEIYVHKSAKLLDLMMNGRLFKRYAVGLGRYGKTPLGTFKTVVHQMNPDWTPPSGGIIPFGDPRNVLGTRWMSIQDASRPDIKGFGIHGTSERDSIGGETSNGCVRMLNEDVEELYMLIPRGTEVTISE